MNWICIEYLIFIVLDYDVEEAKNSSIDVFRNSVAVIKKDTDPPVSLLREDNYFAVSKQAGGNPPRREQYGRAFRLKWLISTWCHQAKCCLFFCLFVSFFFFLSSPSFPLCSECVCLTSSPILFENFLKYRMWIQERTAVCLASLCSV